MDLISVFLIIFELSRGPIFIQNAVYRKMWKVYVYTYMYISGKLFEYLSKLLFRQPMNRMETISRNREFFPIFDLTCQEDRTSTDEDTW